MQTRGAAFFRIDRSGKPLDRTAAGGPDFGAGVYVDRQARHAHQFGAQRFAGVTLRQSGIRAVPYPACR